jgi:hypothetical protein
MPTGYTAPVEAGEITDFPTFALLCARAFGALVLLRDEPLKPGTIPQTLKPEAPFYAEKLAQLDAALAELDALTSEQVEQLAITSHADEMARHLEREVDRKRRLARNEAMKAEVEKWTPPTKDHSELWAFMLKQLRMSAEMLELPADTPETLAGEAWRRKRRERLISEKAYYLKRHGEVQALDLERQSWLDALRGSLPEPTPIKVPEASA